MQLRSAIAMVVCLCALPLLAAERLHLRVVVPPGTGDPIYLAGSFPEVGGWKVDGVKLQRETDGTYGCDITIPNGQTLEFKFNRGDWNTVEKNADGSERPNRRLTAGAGPEAWRLTIEAWADGPARPVAHSVVGELNLLTCQSKHLGRPVTLRVWLPPGYQAESAARFPVLYLHDGQNCFDRATTAFGTEWGVDETLTTLIGDQTLPPLIAVGIDNGGVDRMNDYTFNADPRHGGGHADAYAAFLLEEAMPLIAKTFRTRPGAASTFLGGSSLGGLVTLEIARRHPGTFGGIIVMSPSLWWNNESLIADIEQNAAPLGKCRIWLDMGTAEQPGPAGEANVARARRLDATLTRQQIPHRLMIDDNAQHNEAAWAKRFGPAITYLMKDGEP